MKTEGSTARRVRVSGLAGSWYEADPARLRREIESWMQAAPDPCLPAPPSGLILPHAGYAFCGAVAAAGLRAVAGRSYRRVVAIGPSHRAALPDAAAVPAGVTHIRTPLGEAALDIGAIGKLSRSEGFRPMPAAGEEEHSVEILLPLLQAALGRFAFVPVVIGQTGEASVERIARGLRPLLAGGDALLAVSTDFTHYGPRFGYKPFDRDVARRLEKLDLDAFGFIERGDPEGFREYLRRTGATICGRDPLLLLLELMGTGQRVHFLAYDTSGNRTGDFETCVSYLGAAVTGPWPEGPGGEGGPGFGEEDRKALLRLAREAIEARLGLRSGEPALPDSPALRRPAGVFVTLYAREALRGCLGEMAPRLPLAGAVARLAAAAAFEDPRFPPLRREEWPAVTLDISVLGPLRRAASWKDIVIGRHGVVLHKQGRSAVFLPQVAVEQGWDLTETLSALSRKAGLEPDAWRKGARFEIFEAEVLREPPRSPSASD